jgi:catechol 2,3-dioxygenase-like lactoylglutathione lyase family enzyme
MSIAFNGMKLVVHDLATAERFYRAMGFKLVSRNTGGEGNVAQEQCWLSVTGDTSAHLLILSRFLECPPAPQPAYPREVWLVFTVSDVDATVRRVQTEGGSTLRAGQDRPEHNVRAAVVSDPEGHIIEIVGPMSAGRSV